MDEKRKLRTEKRTEIGRALRATAPNGRELFVAKNDAGCWGAFYLEGETHQPWDGGRAADLQNHATRESAQARLRAYAEKLGWVITEEKASRKERKSSRPSTALRTGGDAEARRTTKKAPETDEGPQRELTNLFVAECYPTPANCRTFDPKHPDAQFLELMEDVKLNGVLQPVLARMGALPNGAWEILAGERRLRAAQAAGLPTIPAIVYENLSDAEAHKLTVKENFNRADLKPLEESRAVRMILEDNGGDAKAAAAFFGRSERWVALRAKLLDLSPKWLKAIADQDSFAFGWSAAHLELIARLDRGIQDALLIDDWNSPLHGIENAGDGSARTVRELDQWIGRVVLRLLRSAPFSREDATLVEKAGACVECSKRSSCQGLLFVETDKPNPKDDKCLDARCWQEKVIAWTKQRIGELQAEHGSVVLLMTGGSSYNDDKKAQGLFGAEPESEYRYERVKAGEKGAKPAVVVAGTGMGELRWVKSASRASGSGRREKKGPTPLKDRKATLERKRLSVVLTELRAAVLKLPFTKLPDKWRAALPLIGLAATFGTHRNNSDVYYRRDQPIHKLDENCGTKEINLWKQLEAWRADAFAQAEDALWACVRQVLARRLRVNLPITQTPERLGFEAERIAGLCGIDLKPIREHAREVYREPKGWKLLNPNGTSKTVSTAKDTKAAKKAKARKRPDSEEEGDAE